MAIPVSVVVSGAANTIQTISSVLSDWATINGGDGNFQACELINTTPTTRWQYQANKMDHGKLMNSPANIEQNINDDSLNATAWDSQKQDNSMCGNQGYMCFNAFSVGSNETYTYFGSLFICWSEPYVGSANGMTLLWMVPQNNVWPDTGEALDFSQKQAVNVYGLYGSDQSGFIKSFTTKGDEEDPLKGFSGIKYSTQPGDLNIEGAGNQYVVVQSWGNQQSTVTISSQSSQ